MADIKQAAKWMQEGNKVRRVIWPSGYYWLPWGDHVLIELHAPLQEPKDALFGFDDLLADDWEIVL